MRNNFCNKIVWINGLNAVRLIESYSYILCAEYLYEIAELVLL